MSAVEGSVMASPSPLVREPDCSSILDTIQHQQVPVPSPTASEGVPSITGRGLANEDADVPPSDVIEEIAPWRFLVWALESLRDSGTEGVPLELRTLEDFDDLIGSCSNNGGNNGLGLRTDCFRRSICFPLVY